MQKYACMRYGLVLLAYFVGLLKQIICFVLRKTYFLDNIISIILPRSFILIYLLNLFNTIFNLYNQVDSLRQQSTHQ